MIIKISVKQSENLSVLFYELIINSNRNNSYHLAILTSKKILKSDECVFFLIFSKKLNYLVEFQISSKKYCDYDAFFNIKLK